MKPSLVVETNQGGATGTAYFGAIRLEEALVATVPVRTCGAAHAKQLVTQVTNPVGDFANFEYNAAGFTTKVTPNGDASKAVSYTPDSLQRLQAVGLPDGLTASYSYTGNGLLKTVAILGVPA